MESNSGDVFDADVARDTTDPAARKVFENEYEKAKGTDNCAMARHEKWWTGPSWWPWWSPVSVCTPCGRWVWPWHYRARNDRKANT